MNLKRKGPDDGDPSAALYGLLPSKKLRQESEDFLPDFSRNGPVAIPEVCPVEIPSDTPVDSTPISLIVTEPDADDRALVLYRPMDLPDRSKPRLRQVNGSFPRHYRDFQVSDAVEWFSPSKSFKHDFALSSGMGMNNSLAVIPYVAPPSFRDGGRVIIEDITDQVRQEEEDQAKEQAMAMEEEATPMDEEMADATVDEAPPQFIVQQPCEVPSWHLFDPNFATPVMWSSGS
ncbi:uncharacterized protein LOC112349610 isoform X1 [Selaginella moellendorffii]|uniref:uncharacterized protein LOC112349610 isoform X1 n=1 Tax=Selaginella moellendorffii TaxID=88036 RepID=UPI000D1CA720|nr:uncharacterized protein LOC112349610 isoform X1 [Selaginella moellendorffii]|eukprot:XP_024540099.1 uncharacterized protein LOC112349610 isoform X1 [Selaginella moellendorffii]